MGKSRKKDTVPLTMTRFLVMALISQPAIDLNQLLASFRGFAESDAIDEPERAEATRIVSMIEDSDASLDRPPPTLPSTF